MGVSSLTFFRGGPPPSFLYIQETACGRSVSQKGAGSGFRVLVKRKFLPALRTRPQHPLSPFACDFGRDACFCSRRASWPLSVAPPLAPAPVGRQEGVKSGPHAALLGHPQRLLKAPRDNSSGTSTAWHGHVTSAPLRADASRARAIRNFPRRVGAHSPGMPPARVEAGARRSRADGNAVRLIHTAWPQIAPEGLPRRRPSRRAREFRQVGRHVRSSAPCTPRASVAKTLVPRGGRPRRCDRRSPRPSRAPPRPIGRLSCAASPSATAKLPSAHPTHGGPPARGPRCVTAPCSRTAV